MVDSNESWLDGKDDPRPRPTGPVNEAARWAWDDAKLAEFDRSDEDEYWDMEEAKLEAEQAAKKGAAA